MGLTLRVRPGDRGTVIWVSGEIDVDTTDALQDALLQVMRTHGAWLLLDLSGVSFMDCAGLRALVLTQRRAELRNGSIRLIAASAAVHRILDLTKMQDVFPVHDHRSDINGAASSPPMRAEPHHGRSVDRVRQCRRPERPADEPHIPGSRPGPRKGHVGAADRRAGDG
jgi:anti-sigma B factor antagonist